MRREHPHRPPSRLLAGLLVPAMLAAGGAAEADPDEFYEEARDVVGIMIDNQDRCLKLSYGKLDILEADYEEGKKTEEIGHYLKEESRTSVRVVGKALDIARRLVNEIESVGFDNRSRTIHRLLTSQQALCSWATNVRTWYDADKYRDYIREQLDIFDDSRSSLPGYLQLDSSERREVVLKYRDRLYSISRDATDEQIESSIAEDGGLLDDLPPLSDDDYRRKQEEYAEWLTEQERQEAAERRRDAQKRKEMQERIEPKPREMPRLELNVPEQKPAAAADPEAMAAWHADYSAKITPFKRSLSQYLKVRAHTRNLIMFNACVDLARISGKVLEDPTALAAPDPQVAKPLREAVRQFKLASDACVTNRLKMTRDSIAAGEQSLGEVIKALKPYELGL